ncbi:MAG TPA: sigma-70 family RNA polymerase sigma factor, partial [Polyangiaceae bacterium]|nr:sigma-70 family RNA polymerase sigma factor [Polyangiaceae bacterium]
PELAPPRCVLIALRLRAHGRSGGPGSMKVTPKDLDRRAVEILSYGLSSPSVQTMARPVLARPNDNERSDRDLVAAAQTGDIPAYGVLVERYQRRIHRLAAHMLKNRADADDITQETFVRAYKALSRFDGRSEPFTWIYRIAINLALNVLRSRRVRRHATTDDDPRLESQLVEQRPGYADPAGNSADRELFATLSEAMDSLSETLRTTLVLVCVDGQSLADAARILGCPEGTVAWRVHEARKKLRERLSAAGVEVSDLTEGEA